MGLAALALLGISGALAWASPGAARALQDKPRVGIDDLAWLAGEWQGDMVGEVAEETWSKPERGAMMGMFRLLGEKKTSVFEFLLLEEGPDGLHLRLQHFGPGYKVWEKERPLEFRLTAATDTVFTFESPDPTQSPTRILYAEASPTQMIVTVETIRDGRVAESFDVVYARAE
jgi:hypothetical protein